MSSYVKRRNCCVLKKSKKYFESIRQNTNEMLDVINEFTIKGEFCEFKTGDLERLSKMRYQIGKVIKGWAAHTKSKLASEILYDGFCSVDANGNVLAEGVGNKGINFKAQLHMAGSKLQAQVVEMYELKDIVLAPFVTGSKVEFIAEYESNPDILIEDISEFLQAIDKLESLMKALSQDNNQRDPDTEFCCEGNPPPGGKPSCPNPVFDKNPDSECCN